MNNYTVFNNSKINIYIQGKLDIIVSRILSCLGQKNIQAIILTGSFGRGEGGVVTNRDIKLVNDFDINIICKQTSFFKISSKYKDEINNLSQELAQEVGIKQVDLGISHPYRFYFSSKTISAYEYLHGCKILYGDINLEKFKYRFDSNSLSVIDGTQYFLTRGSGLLLAAYYFLENKNINLDDRENYYIELNKAILAIGDSILLLSGKYHYSYKERINNIKQVKISSINNFSLIKELYISAINWKLKPRFKWDSDEDEIERWFLYTKLFSEFYLWFESNRLKKEFYSWEVYLNDIYVIQEDFNRNFYKKIFYSLQSRSLKYLFFKDFSAKLSIMPGLLFSIKDRQGNYDNSLLKQALLNMREYYKVDSKFDLIESIENYLEIFHPRGVISKRILDRSGN